MVLPILKIHNALVTSIHRHMRDEEALQFMEEILMEVNRVEPRAVVIDLSAVGLIDSYLSRVLMNAGTSCRAMGARVILCGLQPDVAITLIEMGRGLMSMETATDLDHALHLMGLRIIASSETEGEP